MAIYQEFNTLSLVLLFKLQMERTNFHILNPRDKTRIALLTFTILKHET